MVGAGLGYALAVWRLAMEQQWAAPDPKPGSAGPLIWRARTTPAAAAGGVWKAPERVNTLRRKEEEEEGK